jgi:hypothetical protein
LEAHFILLFFNSREISEIIINKTMDAFSKDMIAGTVAGMLSKLVEYPFDTIKVWKQTSTKQSEQNLGIRALYRGISAPLAASMVENAINFTVYGWTTRFAKSQGIRPEFSSVIGGAAAGFCVAHLHTPVELIKCRMQVGEKLLIKDMIKNPRELFRGYGATLVREIPGGMIYFGTYEAVVQTIAKFQGLENRDQVGGIGFMTAGSIGGMAYWTLIYPADLVKSRQQTQTSPQPAFEILKEVYKSNGVRGIFSGLGITLIRAIPANAVIFYAYETVSKLLEPY